MGLKRNKRYAVHIGYSTFSRKEGDLLETSPTIDKSHRTLLEISNPTSKLFIIKGKGIDFGDLNLKEYQWEIRNAPTPQQKRFLESTSGYLDHKETIFYTGPQGNAILHVNKKKHIHKLKINIYNYGDENPNTMKMVKSMFEREWECELGDKEESSDLVEKIREN